MKGEHTGGVVKAPISNFFKPKCMYIVKVFHIILRIQVVNSAKCYGH